MNQSNWYSQQQPYPGYEEQELENSHPATQDPSHQMHPTSHSHNYGSKSVNGTSQHYTYNHPPTISTGSSHPNFNNLHSGRSKDQRLAAAKQRYRQIPREEPTPSQPWSQNSDPSFAGYQPSYGETSYGGYQSTPGSNGFMSHHYSSNHPLPSEHQVPPTPHLVADSPAPSSKESDLRNERRRQMERQRRQKDNEILARAEYSRDPILLEQAEMIRAKRKRKEDRAQMRYKMMSDDKKEELRQRKRMQQRMRDLKKSQEE